MSAQRSMIIQANLTRDKAVRDIDTGWVCSATVNGERYVTSGSRPIIKLAEKLVEAGYREGQLEVSHEGLAGHLRVSLEKTAKRLAAEAERRGQHAA
jgi:hypothetical protein